MSRDHHQQPTAQRATLTCLRCGELGWFEGDWVHVRVPAYRHRFVPGSAPTEAQQDRLQAQHVVDFGPIPEPHEVDCPCGFDHGEKAVPLEEIL